MCAITFAKIQGKKKMMARFRNSSVLSRDVSSQPLLFCSSGENQGQPEPFPSAVGSSEATKLEDGKWRCGEIWRRRPMLAIKHLAYPQPRLPPTYLAFVKINHQPTSLQLQLEVYRICIMHSGYYGTAFANYITPLDNHSKPIVCWSSLTWNGLLLLVVIKTI